MKVVNIEIIVSEKKEPITAFVSLTAALDALEPLFSSNERRKSTIPENDD